MALTRTQAQARWRLGEIEPTTAKLLEALRTPPAILTDVDLAGIDIGAKSPLPVLREVNLYRAQLKRVNLRYASISGSMNESLLECVDLQEAVLDRCLLKNASVVACDFSAAKLIVNTDDTTFDQCQFRNCRFGNGKQGHEYGGRRVKFVRCDFTGAVFSRVEFRAAFFSECRFDSARFVGCDLRGAKATGGFPTVQQFEAMEPPLWACAP